MLIRDLEERWRSLFILSSLLIDLRGYNVLRLIIFLFPLSGSFPLILERLPVNWENNPKNQPRC